MASPAEIVRQILINDGLVELPPVPGQLLPQQQMPNDGTTACYVSSMPDTIDQAVMIKDIAGKYSGRLMRGRSTVHFGLLIKIRALDESGYTTIAAPIYLALDEFMPSIVMMPDGTEYPVQSVYPTSDIINIGEQVGKRREQWTINARLAFRDFSLA
jgi:hypothetical protein